MNIGKRISAVEQIVHDGSREELVAISAYTEKEYLAKETDYLRDHPAPKLFVWIRKFSAQ